jgi:hypothetical protein
MRIRNTAGAGEAPIPGDSNARVDPSTCRFCGKPATQREPIQCSSNSSTGMHMYIRI